MYLGYLNYVSGSLVLFVAADCMLVITGYFEGFLFRYMGRAIVADLPICFIAENLQCFFFPSVIILKT